MHEMRRKNQQLDSRTALDVLEKGRRGVLAISRKEEYAYAVPLNYWFDREKNTIYFHGSASGYKLDALKENSRVSFNVLSEPIAEEGKWYSQFNSATAFGTMEIIEDREEKKRVLYQIGKKYFPPEEDVDAHVNGSVDHVCIMALSIDYITGKHINER